MLSHRMKADTADHGKSLATKDTKGTRSLMFVPPLFFGSVRNIGRRMIQEVKKRRAIFKSCFPFVFLRVPLWLVLQLAENLRRSFQRQSFGAHISSYACFFQAVADDFLGIVFLQIIQQRFALHGEGRFQECDKF